MLLNRLNINTAEDKEQLAWQYSEGRTTSTSELKIGEYNQLLKDLQNTAGKNDAANIMRRKIISRAHEMSWTIEVDGIIKADIDRINNWCLKFGYLHKPLNSYSQKELPALVSQFDKVYYDFLKNV